MHKKLLLIGSTQLTSLKFISYNVVMLLITELTLYIVSTSALMVRSSVPTLTMRSLSFSSSAHSSIAYTFFQLV